MRFAAMPRDSTTLYGELAEAVAAYFLRCGLCGAEKRPSREEMAGYFRAGWPECCGETMKLTAQTEQP